MAALDRALDEIVSERQRGSGHRGRRGGRRNDFPRDGIRKSYREDATNIDSDWVHDKFENESDPGSSDSNSAKLRVENLHYDLTEDDLDDLFNRIGPVLKTALTYDRAGRSEGVAYITYEHAEDAKKAIRDFDGANAKGQPIRVISIPSGPSGRGPRNPFDSANVRSRPLESRITRTRSMSPVRHSDVSGPAPSNVDRYVPGGRRSRSPLPRRREGRPPGARRDRGDRRGRGRGERGGRGKEGLARDGRPKKTQEELDAEMEDYWGGKTNGESTGEAAPAAPVEDDTDMIE
ncbi:hypothetical protein B0O99DRAFT_588098 [Bisporella sp. PMI_857]|nr:hypothetical protein B0O99DRAFT_588098 [Bisporella sp. PMI_857]